MHHSLVLTGDDSFLTPSGPPPPFHAVPVSTFPYGHPLHTHHSTPSATPTTFAWDVTRLASQAPFPGDHVYDKAFGSAARQIFRDRQHSANVIERYRQARKVEFSQEDQVVWKQVSDKATRLEMDLGVEDASGREVPRDVLVPRAAKPRAQQKRPAPAPEVPPTTAKRRSIQLGSSQPTQSFGGVMRI